MIQSSTKESNAMDGQKIQDVFVIGGGINGCGIARDLVGRGLSVELAEMADIGGATSSASTKLFHGGLRYLEYFEFSLVKKALTEREVLLSAMPHISWPLRFIIPYHQDMRFDNTTPAAQLLSKIFPWLKGQRPAWVIRLGLFLYDHLGGRKILPPTSTLDLSKSVEGDILQDKFKKAFEYSDCWIQDARLVTLNARDARDRGATIMPHTVVTDLKRVHLKGTHLKGTGGHWEISLHNTITNKKFKRYARCVVNASGPWIENIIKQTANIQTRESIRLVRGSHIVVKKLYDHDKAYFLQGTDGRIMFAIPYEQDYTLIGTTDENHSGSIRDAKCSDDEMAYMCDFANQYFKKSIAKKDIVWTYAGIRPLYDNGAEDPSATTRDYTFSLNTENGGAPLLNIFGGKITTYRKLAEAAFDHIAPFFPQATENWTAGQPLAGGDFAITDTDDLIAKATQDFPFLDTWQATRLVRCYGLDIWHFLKSNPSKNGQNFGAGLTEAEIKWLIKTEFAHTAEDVLWRRTKMGLHLTKTQIKSVEKWFNTQK